MKFRQSLNQNLEFKLSPQQIQLLSFLQTPNILLESALKNELEKNIVLEFEDNNEGEQNQKEDTKTIDDDNNQSIDDIKTDFNDNKDDNPELNYNDSIPEFDDKRFINLKNTQNITELLNTQLSAINFTPLQKIIAQHIIGNLDPDGLLHIDPHVIIDELLFQNNINISEDELDEVLKQLQTLEPAGIVATSLQECLLLQLERIPLSKVIPWVPVAKIILIDYYELFVNRNYGEIKKQLNIDDVILAEVVNNLKKLNPRPGNFFNDINSNKEIIIPDFIVHNDNTTLKIELLKEKKTRVRINPYYKNLFLQYTKEKKTSSQEAAQFLKEKIQQAEQLMQNLVLRDEILLNTMKLIVDKQTEYFLTGDQAKLKPMILKDIAEITKMSISGISKIINSKFVQTDYGILSLKFFFGENYQNEQGEIINSREIKQILKEMIDKENKKHPLTDLQLMDNLKRQNFNLLRRTVANYRTSLNIPIAKLRKEI